MARDLDEDSGRPFMKVNHLAPGDVVGNPAHVAEYGTAFEGTISLRIRDDRTVIAEGFAQGGSNGVIGESKADLEFDRRPNQRPGGRRGLRGEREQVRRGSPPVQGPDRLPVAGSGGKQ